MSWIAVTSTEAYKVRHMQAIKSYKESQTVIAGIMFVRKGKELGSISSAYHKANVMANLQRSFDLYSAEPDIIN